MVTAFRDWSEPVLEPAPRVVTWRGWRSERVGRRRMEWGKNDTPPLEVSELRRGVWEVSGCFSTRHRPRARSGLAGPARREKSGQPITLSDAADGIAFRSPRGFPLWVPVRVRVPHVDRPRTLHYARESSIVRIAWFQNART